MNPLPPVVYAGPSIAPDEVQRYLPGAVLLPPVHRGDLYRDRTLGFTVFVILDGVFFHHLAIPPREIMDLLADGACLVGASSMGAIRAAECWPAGMRGVGSIYRLFRRGVLESDDEVAVAYVPGQAHRIATVPLVNVRFALSRALRDGTLSPSQAGRILEAARTTFYPERNWRTLIRNAGIEDPEGRLATTLSALNLKRADAVRALRATARLLARQPGLLGRPRRTDAFFIPNESTREPGHNAFGRQGRAILEPQIWCWLLASGRYRRYPFLEVELDAPRLTPPDTGWQQLAAAGELDALAYQYRATILAAQAADELGLEAGQAQRMAAEQKIAREHGRSGWQSLRQSLQNSGWIWASILEYRQRLAQALVFRDHRLRFGG